MNARTKEAIRLIKRLVYPNIDLKIHHNAKFTKSDLLDVLVHVSAVGDFANNGAATFSVLNSDRPAPSGDLMMHHFSKLKSLEEIREMFRKTSDVIFNFVKRNYNVLNKRKLEIAYDIHKVPFYGKDLFYTRGGKNDRGTNQFFEFLTCSIVEKGERFILDVLPMSPFDDLDKLMDESLARVRKKIRIEIVYCDRGFNRSKIFKVLKKHKVKFLMPMVRSISVKAAFDKSEGIESRVFKDFKVADEKVNLVLVDDELGLKRAFVCNFDIHQVIAYRLYGLYSRRWGIETSYRNLDHDFKPRTTTRNYNIRLFYFLFSCCLYNLWVLVNICVSMVVYGEIQEKPIITAKMFAILLYKVREEYLDSG